MTTHSYQVDLLVNEVDSVTGAGYRWVGGNGLLVVDASISPTGVVGFQYRTGPSATFLDYSVIDPATGAVNKVVIDKNCAFNFNLPPCEIRATTDANVTGAFVRAIRIPD